MLRDHGYEASASRGVLVLIVSTHEGMARLSSPGWLITNLDGFPDPRQSPEPVLIGIEVWSNLVDIDQRAASIYH